MGLLGRKIANLLSPIASIASHGGPMKMSPASVHFFAKVEFSLSYIIVLDRA